MPRLAPRSLAFSVILLCAMAGLGCAATPDRAEPREPQPQAAASTPSPAPDNAELQSLCAADQADRQAAGTVNWHEVKQRDAAREKRVREMLEEGTVITGRDYFNAALICQHSTDESGIMLAHELSMIGAVLGDKRSRWLAAASYDRLLNRLGKPQRFGTQYMQTGDAPMSLGELTPGVTDAMRTALNVPTLAQAKAREEEIRKAFEKPAAK